MPQILTKRHACCVLGLCAFFCGAAAEAEAQEQAPAECKGIIDGHVVDRQEHQAIAGAEVWIEGILVSTTNSAGHFVVGGQCAGKVKIRVQNDFLKPAETHAIVRTGRVTPVEIEATYVGDEVVEIKHNDTFHSDTRSTSDVDGEELDRNRGKSLTDIAATQSGVTALGSGTSSSKPIIRGQFGRRLAILNDGIPHRAQSWGLDHSPEIESFSAGAIRVLRGAAGVRYGPQAVGGALLIEPPPLAGLKGISGETHLLSILGFGGGVQSRWQGSHPALPSLAASVEGTFKKLAAAATPDYALQNTGSEESSLGFSVAFTRPRHRHRLTAKRFDSQLGVCACFNVESYSDFLDNLTLSEPGSVQHFQSRFQIDRAYQDVRHDQATSRSRFEIGNLGHADVSYSVQRNLRQEFDTVRTTQTRGPQLTFDTLSQDLLASFTHHPYHFHEHLHLDGTFGINGTLQRLDFDGNPGRTLLPSYDNTEASVYAIESLRGHAFEIEAGVRLDLVRRTGKLLETELERLSRGTGYDTSRCPQSGSTSDYSFSYNLMSVSLGGLYQLSTPWVVKANLSSTSRAPSPDEQFINGRAPSFPVFGLGDPGLSPERTHSSSLSTTFLNAYFDVQLSVFANLVQDYIYFAPRIDENGVPESELSIVGELPLFTNTSIDASFLGTDGSAWLTPHPNFRVGTMFSLVRGQDRSADQPLSFVPPDRYRGSLEYNSKGDNPIWVRTSVTQVRSQQSFNPMAELAPPPAGYTLVDLELGLQTAIYNQDTRFTLQGHNIFNQRYRDYLSISRYFNDQPGMQWMLRVSFYSN